MEGSTKITKRKKKTKRLEIIIPSKLSNSELFSNLNTYKSYLEADNEYLKEEQQRNIKDLTSNTNFDYLYPHPDDPFFNKKIMSKKEFYDLMYIKPKIDSVEKLKKLTENACNQQIFELMTHQLFIRNYLSFNTPYNSLLLFHGLGTGKTCSAISITEMMRTYFNQIGINKRIIIVASPNVQTNFKIQLFNENKLEEINGLWNLNDCTGNKFLKEINPMNMRGLKKEEVIRLIKRIIKQSYTFMGSEQFSNYIQRIMERHPEKKKKLEFVKTEFSNRMIVIDEVHNIRNIKDTPSKKTTKNLMFLVKSVENLKLLLLTATPMFNSNEEIIWLLNLMNANDKRPLLQSSDIFDSSGNLRIVTEDNPDERFENGYPIGEKLLIQKSRSYVSYIRGENPYSFPFKITPSMFMSKNTMKQYNSDLPKFQISGMEIDEHINFLDLTVTSISSYQQSLYTAIIDEIRDSIPDPKYGIGYQLLSLPIQALTITYPFDKFDTTIKRNDSDSDSDRDSDRDSDSGRDELDYRLMVGKKGIQRIMEYDKTIKRKFKYTIKTQDKYGRIFSPKNLINYSSKISFICNKILNSDGIILVYSQYIDGGCLPMALALEELGFVRYGSGRNLFNTKPTDSIDSITFSNKDVKNNASYAMITGDILLSPNNEREIKALIDKENTNGEKIKVVIISEAGSEGIDLKCVRQVHIIDPWFNLGRIEQIVGRAIRNCSHKHLPFEKRNVEIHMHATKLLNEYEESADMYVYRIAERKAIKIGKINRLLKENSIDCIVNKNIIESDVVATIDLSSKGTLPFKYNIKDKPFSYVCDYMSNCNYKCGFNKKDLKMRNETYDETFITLNIDVIINKIKELFSEGYIYKRDDIFKRIQYIKPYSGQQIDSALSRLVNDNSEIVFDFYNNKGRIVNIDKYYLFNPIKINSKHISSFERTNMREKHNSKISILLSDLAKKTLDIDVLLKKYENDFKDTTITHIGRKPNKRKGDKDLDWYISAGNFFNTKRNVIQLDRDLFNEFVIKHMMDTIDYSHKVMLIEHLFINKAQNEFEHIFLEVLKKHYLVKDKYFYLGNFLTNNNNYLRLTTDKTRRLVKVTATEKKEIILFIKKNTETNVKERFNKIIGFIGNFKKKYNVFKIKDSTIKKDKGYRADQKGKRDILDVLNLLKIPNLEKGKGKYIKYTTDSVREISNARELCVDQELILRYYDSKRKDDKRWFLSYEESIINTVAGNI